MSALQTSRQNRQVYEMRHKTAWDKSDILCSLTSDVISNQSFELQLNGEKKKVFVISVRY